MRSKINVKNLRGGELVDFKRVAGRGRPALGKVIKVNLETVRIENTLGKFESIRPSRILQIRDSRPTRRTKAEVERDRAAALAEAAKAAAEELVTA